MSTRRKQVSSVSFKYFSILTSFKQTGNVTIVKLCTDCGVNLTPAEDLENNHTFQIEVNKDIPWERL